MATINVSQHLDVLPKFTCLMQESVSGESIYIRTKETLEAIFQEYSMNSAEKASVIANVLGTMSSSITSTAMSVALQWATQERQLELDKLRLAKELDILDADLALREAQADKTGHESIATQAQTIRMYGTPVVVGDLVMSLAPEGKVLADTNLVEQQRTNLIKELDVIEGRIKEQFASIHRTVADTVVNHGAWTYSIGETGIVTAPARTTPNAVVPLSDIQRIIASEQAKGYVYNAWANSVTASAGMLGTAIASDGAISNISDLVTVFRTGLEKLQNTQAPTMPT